MKKLFSCFIVFAILTSFSVPAFAVGDINTLGFEGNDYLIGETDFDDGIMPIASQVLSFDLKSGEYATSTGTYYVSDEDSILKIIAASWDPQDAKLQIGWYNIRTGNIYYVPYTGGQVTNKKINSKGLTDGTYRVIVKNVSNLEVKGSMTFSVS